MTQQIALEWLTLTVSLIALALDNVCMKYLCSFSFLSRKELLFFTPAVRRAMAIDESVSLNNSNAILIKII